MPRRTLIQGLNRLLKILIENELDFVVIGGFAGVIHGSSLVTRDLNLCLLLTPENVEKLRHVLKDLHPKHRMTPKKLSFLQVPEPGVPVNNLYLETDIGVIDIISQVTGVGSFPRISENATKIELLGHPCKVISIEDLILAKSAMGRPKDQLMIQELQAIKSKFKP